MLIRKFQLILSLSVFAFIATAVSFSTSAYSAGTRLQNAAEGDSKQAEIKFVRLRIATPIAQPPFAFLDRQNKLSGFNIDLARRLCAVLKTVDQCEIQAMRDSDIKLALNDRSIDGAIGVFQADAKNRAEFYFSRSFYRPSHFLIRNNSAAERKIIGILENDIPIAIAQAVVPGQDLRLISNRDALFEALSKNEINGALVDGTEAQFWLLSDVANNCCTYSGPYFLRHNQGHSHHIAMRLEDEPLHLLVAQALRSFELDGTLDELRRRYLPLSNDAG